jgi:spermidine synthase
MVRALALLLTAFTGFSGLVYEVTWQKYLATLLGSHSEATAAVLAIFLGGLSLGYALFGRVSLRLVGRAKREGRAPRLLLVYGVVEVAIGVYAWFFPLAFAAAQTLSLWLPLGGAGPAFAFDVLLAALLIGPPAVLMGGTIPILTQALARNLADATRFHAFVYAFNTAGAFAGALAAGFWLVPALGLIGVLRAMGLVNLAAGCVFLALGLRSGPTAVPRTPEVPARAIQHFASYAGVALLSGFAMMAIQTVLIRLGALSFGSSHFTFAMVVSVFVLCIALGSFAVSALPRIPRGVVVGNQWALALLPLLLYALLEDSPYYAHVLRSVFRDDLGGFYPFHLNAFAVMVVFVGPPVILSGAVLPLLFNQLRHEVGDLGQVAGRLYSWNTVGSLVGALLGGYALFFWLDLHAIYRVAVAALIGAAALLSACVLRSRWRWPLVGLLVPSLLVLVLLPAWSPDRLYSGVFRLRAPEQRSFDGPDAFFAAIEKPKIVFHTDDPAASVAVKQYEEGPEKVSRTIVSNGKSDGNLPNDYTTMAMAGLLPALFADRTERAFVIGYGTGVTVGELAALDSTREVVVAEISAGVIEAAPLFAHGNLGAATNPKVQIVRSDAYRALLRSQGRFDIIASEPSNPWVTGVEMLFSREFLAAARDRLQPGGVYAQWFHTYEVDDETIELVLRTYASVFDGISVWFAQGADLILLGFADADVSPDLRRISERSQQPDIRAGLARAGIRSFPALLAHELLPLGVVHALELSGPVHTLLHPILSHHAARGFYRGEQGRQPSTAPLRSAQIGADNSLLRRFAASRGEGLSQRAWAAFARETCRHRPEECAVVLARWSRDHPGSELRERLLAESRRKPRLQGSLSAASMARLAQLFDADVALANGEAGLALAKQSTQAFARFYHHAAPFSRRSLAAIWRACSRGRDSVEACRHDQAVAEGVLGDLEVEVR